MSREDHKDVIQITNSFKQEIKDFVERKKLSGEAVENIAEFIILEMMKLKRETA